MKHHITRQLIGLAILFSMHVALAGPPPDIASQAKNSFIFKFASYVKPEEMAGLAADLTESKGGTLRHVFTNVIYGFSASMSLANAQLLVSENSEVTGFVNNGVAHVPGAEGGANKGGKGGKGKPDPTSTGEHVSWPLLPGGIYTPHDATTDNITRHAWIIDTGISDYYGTGNDELTIGNGANYVSKGKDTYDDNNGHGTAVAGIIGAKVGNNTGMVGMASGATVHPVRVLHNNLWGVLDDILSGVLYVKDQIENVYPDDTHVVNMSLTIQVEGQPLAIDIENVIASMSGVNFAVCAGNDSTDANLYTPARMSETYANVYTVAAIDQDGVLASDSNYGTSISFVAPGAHIETLKPGGGTWYWSGCSMATPHVAGILLFQPPVGVANDTGYPLATF